MAGAKAGSSLPTNISSGEYTRNKIPSANLPFWQLNIYMKLAQYDGRIVVAVLFHSGQKGDILAITITASGSISW